MAGRSKYLVFGLGMLALVVGVSLSLWMLLARPALPVQEGAGEASLSQALQQALGLTQQDADALAGRLQEAAAKARATAKSAPGGTQERTSIGDSVDYEVRDGSGKLKQKGSGR